MPYDVVLSDRIRELVEHEANLTEQRMFGGLAFLIGGNMAVAASGQGGLLVRVDPSESAELVRGSAAEPMEMRGRQMGGWLRVGAADVESPDELRVWVKRGVAFARSLPAKR
jgi:hypothetical protein